MSQLETNPLQSPTIVVKNPTQVMEVKPPAQVTAFAVSPLSVRDNKNFSIQQMDLLTLANKNKFIQSFNWPLSTTTSWFNYEFNITNMKNLLPVTSEIMSFANFEQFFCSIKPTSNAYFQGWTILVFDPAPTANYYTSIWGVDYDRVREWQLQKLSVSPKTTNEFNFFVPINFPFNYFKLNPTFSTDVELVYLNSYSFGRLRSVVLAPLQTTSPLTDLTYTLSGQIVDLRTAGTFFYRGT